ncbi:MAG TPA: asparagine synthase (glutamine-hydrolyzing) [Spirochaetota bacterium]|nr:asparagine synthase (glutamine-hydrolyzing) [Spirochaetota bacterium]
MCGITGIISSNISRDNQRDLILKMTSTLQHRGPDGWGIFTAPGCALGHTRLSIIDLSAGHQPMETGRNVISYNGEIYNYEEIREDLQKKGISFKTRSDTEVVLRAYEYYGGSCFSKFNGQFAILIWDRIKKELTIARDRYGVRPLYILKYNGGYYFSSEMKAFDAINGFKRTMDRSNILTHALAWNTLDDNTLFENIRSLPGGTYEIYSAEGTVKNTRYYELGESEQSAVIDYNTAREEFSAILNDAVKIRLKSDVEVGTYLSGGIDSSVITHLTSLHNNERFKTFSVGFTDSEFDESNYQNEMSAKLDSDHLMLAIDYNSIDKTYLEASYHFERPVFRTAPVPLFLLSEAVRSKNIKVVLTGEAADEILYGYDTYKELSMLQHWKTNPGTDAIQSMLGQLYPHLQYFADPKKLGFIKMYYEDFLGDFDNELAGLNIRIKNNAIMASMFNREWGVTFDREKLIDETRKILPANYSSWSLLQRNQFLEMKTLLSGYLLSSQGDRMSMAHGVEGRYPFLDHRLIEKVFYYKDSFKLSGFSHKHILRDTFRGDIPESIIDRPKKPYTAPDLKSFNRDGAWTESAAYFLTPDKIKEYGIFDPGFVQRFTRKFASGIPAEIGYRDNMVISFILSAQMIQYWIQNPKKQTLREEIKTVDISDY